MTSIMIRSLLPADNQGLAAIIRNTLLEFDVPREGTVYSDPTTDHLYELFEQSGSAYFVAEEDGQLLGGCGIYPTPGLPEGCAELVKFYLSASARGKGIGKLLMEKCFDEARHLGYRQLYLESFPQLAKAVSMYKKAGFNDISHALGNSGHYACNIWMVKEL